MVYNTVGIPDLVDKMALNKTRFSRGYSIEYMIDNGHDSYPQKRRRNYLHGNKFAIHDTLDLVTLQLQSLLHNCAKT